MLRVGRLRLIDFHCAALLLLRQIQIGLVPFQALLHFVFMDGGGVAAVSTGHPRGGGGAAVASILEGVG